jgi:anti-sigma regulatory factor (Ser/Thr protein kinase)
MISSAVRDGSHVAEARRHAVALARANGFDDEAAGRVALVATELATNLIKHGGGGTLLASAFADTSGKGGIELIALDKGQGISDLANALHDGVSGAGTAGNGLGAVARQSHAMEIYSRAGHGTALVAHVMPARPPHNADSRRHIASRWGAVSIPCAGESVNGDAWDVRADDTGVTVMVADGLGHGPAAADAAGQAMRLFDRHWRLPPVELMTLMHAGMRGTRGAAISIARLDIPGRRVVYVGIGNVAGSIIEPQGAMRRMVSLNGTVGHTAARIRGFEYPVADPATATLVLHSDGVSSGWVTSAYPGLMAAHPALVAAVLYRDFARPHDDATVVALRGATR